MLFTTIDVIIIVLIAVTTAIGWVGGLVQALGALVGIVAGVFVARRYTDMVTVWARPFISLDPALVRLGVFTVLVVAVQQVAGVGIMLASYPLRLIARLPFLGTINRLGGAVVGLIEGSLIAGIVVIVARQPGLTPAWVSTMIAASPIARTIGWIVEWLIKLIPHGPEYLKLILSVPV